MYQKPVAIKMEFGYEVAFAKKCHFADYRECSPSEQQYK